MSGLRDEIRAILREELAALRAETDAAATESAAAESPACERVQIANSADLTRFAQDLVARAADPAFAARVARGGLIFEKASDPPGGAQSYPARPSLGRKRWTRPSSASATSPHSMGRVCCALASGPA